MNHNDDSVKETDNHNAAEADLESSFRSSYRTTYTNLKMYWGGDEALTEPASADEQRSTRSGGLRQAAEEAGVGANSLAVQKQSTTSAPKQSGRKTAQRAGGQQVAPAQEMNSAQPTSSTQAGHPASQAGSTQRADAARNSAQSAQTAYAPPPAGLHAPHHSWHLGSYGGKRKPAGLRQKTNLEQDVPMFGSELEQAKTEEQQQPTAPAPEPSNIVPAPEPSSTAPAPEPSNTAPETHSDEIRHLGGRGIPYSVDGANGQPNLDVLKKIAQQPSALVSPAPQLRSQPSAPLATPNPIPPATPGSTPSATPGSIPRGEQQALGDEDLEPSDLYAPTVEVSKPTPNDQVPESREDEPYDESVAHLYAPTADVAKPNIPHDQLLTPGHGTQQPMSQQPMSQQQTPQQKPHQPTRSQSSIPAQNFPGQAAALASLNNIDSFGPATPTVAHQADPQADPQADSQELWNAKSPHSPTHANAQPPKPLKTQNPATPDAVPTEESLLAEDWENRKSRKPKLASYIDRQIEKEHGDDDQDEDSFSRSRTTPVSPNRKFVVGAIVIIALAFGGTVGYKAITGGGTIPLTADSKLKPIIDQANAAINNGKFADAVALLDNAVKINPNDETLYHKRGLAKLKMHKRTQYDSALEDLNTAIKMNPNLFEAYLDRAAVKIELGQYQDALDDYNKLTELGQDTDKVRFGRGLVKFYTGNYTEAESEFAKLLEKDSSNVDAAIALGTSLDNSGADQQEVESKFAAAARTDTSGLAYRNQAILAFEQGPAGYNAARKFYNDAIDTNPNDANLYNERGIIEWLQKDTPSAIEDFQAALTRNPDLEDARKNLSALNPDTNVATTGDAKAELDQAVQKLKQQDWRGASNAADRAIAKTNWSSETSFDAVFIKWAALNYQGRSLLSGEVLRDCDKHAQKSPWTRQLIKYLLGEIDFNQAKELAISLEQKTDLHYYGAVKDLFDSRDDAEAKKKLEWIANKGSTTSTEFELAKKSLEWLKKEENYENQEEGGE